MSLANALDRMCLRGDTGGGMSPAIAPRSRGAARRGLERPFTVLGSLPSTPIVRPTVPSDLRRCPAGNAAGVRVVDARVSPSALAATSNSGGIHCPTPRIPPRVRQGRPLCRRVETMVPVTTSALHKLHAVSSSAFSTSRCPAESKIKCSTAQLQDRVSGCSRVCPEVAIMCPKYRHGPITEI